MHIDSSIVTGYEIALNVYISVTVLWVPGHQNIEGNDVADDLAGFSETFEGFEPRLGTPKSTGKQFIYHWLKTEHKKL